MSFDTEKIKADSYKIILVEIDIPITNIDVLNYEAGIWVIKLYWDSITVEDDYGIISYYDKEKAFINVIGSVIVDGEGCTQVSSFANLRLQNKSFFFVQGDQKVYIHFDSNSQPLGKIIKLGATTGYCDKPKLDEYGNPTDSYYNDIYYDPRIREVPVIKTQKDQLFYGVVQYNGGTIKLDNADGIFDSFADQDIWGQACRILYGINDIDYDEYIKVFAGYVDDFTYNYEIFNLNITDRRKFFKRKLPIRTFNQTDYPNLNDENVDVVKPIAWGQVYNAPCICLNEDEAAPGTYTFMFLDTTDHDAYSLQTVYVEGEIKVPASSDLSAGTFVLNAADYDPGDDVTADFIGFEDGDPIDNGLDVAKDILANYADIAYMSDNYILSEWGYETQIAPNIGLWIGDGEEKSIEDALNEISVSIDAIILIKDNGKITARSYRANRDIKRVIQSDEWISNPSISYNGDEFLTSAVCLYNKDITEDKYKNRFRNTDYEDDVFEQYGQRNEKEFETLLTNAIDAETKTDNVMEISQSIRQRVSRKTKIQNIDLEIMQFIACEHSRQSSQEKDWAVYELLGISKYLSKAEIQLDMRRVTDYEPPEYDYQQGILWGEYLFGDKIHVVTEY